MPQKYKWITLKIINKLNWIKEGGIDIILYPRLEVKLRNYSLIGDEVIIDLMISFLYWSIINQSIYAFVERKERLISNYLIKLNRERSTCNLIERFQCRVSASRVIAFTLPKYSLTKRSHRGHCFLWFLVEFCWYSLLVFPI